MSAQGVLSRGIKFSYAADSSTLPTSWTEVPDLMSIPSLGGEPEKVEVTCLADGVRRYINGIRDFGDLEFKFLFDNSSATSSYRVLKDIEEAGNRVWVCVEMPDALTASGHGTQFCFKADLAVSIDEAEVNAALTYTCKAGLQSDITPVDPE